MGGTILDRIVETKRAEVEQARRARPLDAVQRAANKQPAPRDFYEAVAGSPQRSKADRLRLIAEIKKSSPSAGLIRADFDPVAIARIYEQAGAAALSVLTDRTYFSGELGLLDRVKEATGLPVLRKDFLVDAYQVFESRAAGADAILLIAEILPIEQIDRMSSIAGELEMTTLIELHAPDRLNDLLPLISPQRKTILGINNRDLHAQRTDLKTTRDLATRLPPGTRFVAESGMKSAADVTAMRQAGACAVLIGETFMRAADIGAKVRELMGA